MAASWAITALLAMAGVQGAVAAGVADAEPGTAAMRVAAEAGVPMTTASTIASAAHLRDDRGRALPSAPTRRRIVSLLPSLTESVCALGACDRLVGTDRFSDHPEAVRTLPKLGGLDDAQVERIVALRPDLVLLSTSARAASRLESLGVPVAAFRSDTVADVSRTLRTLAAWLGDPPAAERSLAAIEADLDRAAARVPAGLRGARTYVEVDATPYAAGEASFLGATLTRLGLAHAVPASLGAFPKLNPEFVVTAAPDLIVASADNAARMRGRPGWASIPALKRGRVCAMPGPRFELLVRPGPRVGEAALRLADCLQGLPPLDGSGR